MVLDAWAVLALLHDEPGAEAIDAEIATGTAVISWINLGEVFYIEARIAGDAPAAAAVAAVRARVSATEVDSEHVLAAARLKARHPLSYADAFAVALAERHRLPLMTGDPEILSLDLPLTRVDPRDVRLDRPAR